MSDWFLELQINIKFCMKLGSNARDTCAVLSKAYGEEAMKKSNVLEWHKWFKEGHENVKDDGRSGCPGFHRTDKNVKKVQSLVHSTFTQAYCVEILKQLYEAVHRKRPELWASD
jgi:hypothetical protein